MLTGKVLEAHFLVPGYDFDGSPLEKEISYPVYEFENGLILVPSDTTNDWFFRSQNNIEGCGNDIYIKCHSTGKEISWTKKQLSQAWGNSVSEFGDTSCLQLVKELLKKR